MSSRNGQPPRITSASASRRSRSSRVPWPLTLGPRYRADVNAGHVSRISPSNHPPASVSRTAGSTASIRARSAGVMRWTERMLTMRMGAPSLGPNYDREISALGRATRWQLVRWAHHRKQTTLAAMHDLHASLAELNRCHGVLDWEHGLCWECAALVKKSIAI